MSNTRDLTQGSIAGHFRALAIPSAIGMVFTTLYNVVDVYFAGLLSTDAQAGLAISFQVFFVLIVLGFGLGTAMSALVGNALGEKDDASARRLSAQGLGFGFVVSLLAMVVGYVFADDLLAIVSTPGSSYRAAGEDYLDLLLLATPAFILTFGANGILVARGDTVSLRNGQIAAFFANLVLNPLFIFGIPGVIDGIGFNGIALSTIVSQTGVLLWILSRVRREETIVPAEMIPTLQSWREILSQALPVSFSMMVMMLAGFVVQYFLKSFGGAAVAAYGVALRIEQLLLLPAFGLTNALLPIAARNFGAKDFDRVREAAWFCFKAGAALMLVASVVLWIAAPMAMRVFSDDPEVIRIGAQYLRVDGFLLPVYVLLFAINSLLQAFKKPLWTLLISVYRQGFGVAVFGYLFVVVLGFGTWGVWLGIAVAVVTGFGVSVLVVRRVAAEQIGGLSAGVIR